MEILNVLLLCVGTLQVTSYRAIPQQTDDSPTWTSIGDRTTMFGCAVSQDLLKSGKVKYGDILYVEGHGYRVVNDCMNVRIKNGIDLFVRTKPEEHKIEVQRRKVYKVLLPTQGDSHVDTRKVR